MKAEVFVDTGAWFALQVPNDRWHAASAAALRDAIRRRIRLVTTNYVVGETYTLLRMTHGHAVAWRFMDALARSTLLEAIRVDEDCERDAWDLLRRHADQNYSFVDGTSFAVMRQRGVRHALAFDKHFASAGFVRVGMDAPLP